MPAQIRDVMPAFELYQPASVADALGVLERHGADAWVMAGGLDTFDWLKDRIRRPKVVVDLSRVAELRGIKEANGGLEIGAMTTLTEVANQRAGQGALRAAGRGRRPGRLAADPQPGHDGRQRLPGRALLVLPRRLAVLPRRRQHLLRRHADGGEPRARHLRRGSLRRGEPVRHGARPDRARRPDGRSTAADRAGRAGAGLLRRAGGGHHPADHAAAR